MDFGDGGKLLGGPGEHQLVAAQLATNPGFGVFVEALCRQADSRDDEGLHAQAASVRELLEYVGFARPYVAEAEAFNDELFRLIETAAGEVGDSSRRDIAANQLWQSHRGDVEVVSGLLERRRGELGVLLSDFASQYTALRQMLAGDIESEVIPE